MQDGHVCLGWAAKAADGTGDGGWGSASKAPWRYDDFLTGQAWLGGVMVMIRCIKRTSHISVPMSGSWEGGSCLMQRDWCYAQGFLGSVKRMLCNRAAHFLKVRGQQGDNRSRLFTKCMDLSGGRVKKGGLHPTRTSTPFRQRTRGCSQESALFRPPPTFRSLLQDV